MLTFAYRWLLAPIVLPPILRRLLPAYRQTQTGVVVPFLDRLAALTRQQPASGAVVLRPPLIQRVSLWLVWLCLVLALARPQWLEKPIIKTLPTRDLLLAVDLSGSMETQDFADAAGQRVDRLTAVKVVLDEETLKAVAERRCRSLILPPEMMQGPYYRIREMVASHGYIQQYTVDS
jgi:Ca-activated chloride channel family protein